MAVILSELLLNLIKAFEELVQQRINDFMIDNDGKWILRKRIPSSVSNMGGVWERQIKKM